MVSLNYEVVKILPLVRGSEIYLFSYNVGDEREVIESFYGLASNSKLNFDYIDAEFLEGRILGRGLEEKVY